MGLWFSLTSLHFLHRRWRGAEATPRPWNADTPALGQRERYSVLIKGYDMARPSINKVLAREGFSSLPMGSDVKPPKLIESDPIATSAWDLAVDQLQKQNRWQDSDRISVERYAVLASLARRYSEDTLSSKGYQTTQSGYRQLAAELSCLLKTSKELLTLEKSLGLSPTARAEIGIEHRPQDEFESWMRENPV